jgi:ribosome-binding ATPase
MPHIAVYSAAASRGHPALAGAAPQAWRPWIPPRRDLNRGVTPAVQALGGAVAGARQFMGFNCGIVGLPNVGKSALFDALTATQAAEAAKYPFSTREPNIGRVAVPDERLDVCARLAKSAKIVPTQLEFVDIAGLVRGASKGQGLGNQFLGHLREVDAIAHILRCFEDDNIVHVEGSVDPIRDAETVETELLLADLESLERRAVAAQKRARGGDKEARAQLAVIEPVLAGLQAGVPARRVPLAPEQRHDLHLLQLLSAKPVLYIANVDEASAAGGNDMSRRVAEYAAAQGAEAVVIAAAIEAELAVLADAAERREFLAALGLAETGLDQVIRAGCGLLDLITFLTAGPKEARAWTITRGTKAPQAAGTIHSDFEKGFIRAETIAYADFVACGGEQGAKDAGKMRLEGADYIVRDGDVMHFRFNV